MTNTDIPAYNLFHQLYKNNEEYRIIIDEGFKSGKIRFFNEEEWSKIKSQNFVSPYIEMKTFEDMFLLGYNI